MTDNQEPQVPVFTTFPQRGEGGRATGKYGYRCLICYNVDDNFDGEGAADQAGRKHCDGEHPGVELDSEGQVKP